MNEEQAEEVISVLYKILDKLSPKQPVTEGAVLPIQQRPKTKRYPLRVDPGTVFRSKPGYNWVCPYCNTAIIEGDMVIAFQAKPDTRTTYAHLQCDEEEQERWR